MKKFLSVFIIILFNVFGNGELNDSFGPLLKIGITRFQSNKIFIKNENGVYSIGLDDKELVMEDKQIVSFQMNNGKICFEGNSYNEIPLKKIDPNTIFSISKDGKNFSRFRGEFLLKPIGNLIVPVNKIYAEEYLYSVVPSEIGTSFPDEAIKAQSVAARTYLYYNLNNSKFGYCDLVDNVNSQMYLGYDKESKKINDLVNQTYNEVLTYEGKAILALFHSTSGGKTASNEDVWPTGKPIPYLRSVNDEGNGTVSPKQNWSLRVSKDSLEEKVGFRVESLNLLSVVEGRVKSLELLGSFKKTVTGEELRRLLGVNNLNSTMFSVRDEGDSFVFEGSGFGHGLGLPQYSAYTMANNGKDYKYILNYYYTGVQLKKF